MPYTTHQKFIRALLTQAKVVRERGENEISLWMLPVLYWKRQGISKGLETAAQIYAAQNGITLDREFIQSLNLITKKSEISSPEHVR